MLNCNYNEKFVKEGLTFDDVLLIPAKSDVTPNMIDLKTQLTKNITLNTPIMSFRDGYRNREPHVAIAIAQEGGIGIIHKNMTIEAAGGRGGQGQAFGTRRYRRPVLPFPGQDSVSDADALMGKYKISGVPITSEDGKLVGILTNRDLRFEHRFR